MTMSKFNPSTERALVAALGILLVAVVPTTFAQSCQIPLFVQQTNVPGNVMLLVDDSGSMGAVVHHSGYDPSVTWTGGFGGWWFWVGADGPVTVNGVTIVLAQGWYQRNYMNWMFWNTTQEQRDSMPTSTRMEVVHAVFSDFVANAPANIRIGLASLWERANGHHRGHQQPEGQRRYTPRQGE